MKKYRIINDDGSWFETLDFEIAKKYKNFIELDYTEPTNEEN